MKKTSKAMRVAAALAIATAMSTCVVAGTFAKYTASGSSSDTATVAKWGVKVSGPNDAFATSYNGEGANSSSVTVSSSDKVIAPGTSGTLHGTEVSGTPEVAVSISHSASVTAENWSTNSYFPIKVTIGSNEVSGNTPQALETAINNELKSSDITKIDPGTNLSGKGSPDLKWEWAYSGDDSNDNTLGNAAAAGTAVPKISISVSTTVTQID